MAIDRNFIGSANLWGDQAGARTCQIIMESNDGAMQQIIENRTDLLDFMEVEELRKVDDFGLTLAFAAVYYDRPDMLVYLSKRGVDLTLPCDAMGFGNPMYYAVSLGKPALIRPLHTAGCYVTSSCDAWFQKTPAYYASRLPNEYTKAEIAILATQTQRAATFVVKNFMRHKYRTRYLVMLEAVAMIQRCIRGMLGRARARWKRSGESDEGSSTYGDYTTSHTKSSLKEASGLFSEQSQSVATVSSHQQPAGDEASIVSGASTTS
jgi:hypothetical protein